MLAALLLVFREGLEAALIITIILAATRGVAQRGQYILGGVVAGGAGAGLLALSASTISAALGGVGAEVFNAAVLLLAVGLLSWHVIWMGAHGKEMAAEVKQLGRDITQGIKPLSALAIVTATTVLREGSEIVLFMQGLAAGAHGAALFVGGMLGLAAAAAAGMLLYSGMIKIPVGKLFSATNVLMIMIAAGMAGKAANYLAAAGWLPEFGARVWDTSTVVSNESILGKALSAFVGYSATPTGIQVLFFSVTIAALLWATRGVILPRKAAVVALIALCLCAGSAQAEENLPKTKLQQLQDYADPVIDAGRMADLTLSDLSLYLKPSEKSKTIFNFPNTNSDVALTVKILQKTKNFYFVEVTQYGGPTSCGNTAKPIKKINGFVLQRQDDIPTLWKFRHMEGLC